MECEQKRPQNETAATHCRRIWERTRTNFSIHRTEGPWCVGRVRPSAWTKSLVNLIRYHHPRHLDTCFFYCVPHKGKTRGGGFEHCNTQWKEAKNPERDSFCSWKFFTAFQPGTTCPFTKTVWNVIAVQFTKCPERETVWCEIPVCHTMLAWIFCEAQKQKVLLLKLQSGKSNKQLRAMQSRAFISRQVWWMDEGDF